MDFTNLKLFMDEMAKTRTVGNAVEVYLRGRKVFQYACGFSDLENKIPMTGAEMFQIYSCSKITTVTAGMQLLEKGRILLTDPLYDYMPEFREMYVKLPGGGLKKADNPILVGDLFSMTAGFDYNLKSPGFQKANLLTRGRMDTVETIRCVAEDPLSFEPGTHWQYSICHDVLAALISVVTGKKFREYVKENIFDPLEMKDSVYHHTEETLARTAQQYRFAGEEAGAVSDGKSQEESHKFGGRFQNVGKKVAFILGEEYDSGGAGIISTVSDYARLAAALAGYGQGISGERILSEYSVRLMRHNRLNEAQLKDFSRKHLTGCGYGLGVRTHLAPERSGLLCGLNEFGWGGAAGSCVIVDADAGLGVFYAQHTLNSGEEYYQPRLRNVVYSCL